MPAFLGRRGFLGWLMNGLLVFFPFVMNPNGVARAQRCDQPNEKGGLMRLPEPRTEDSFSLARAIQGRRTVRSFKPAFLALEQLSQLLWAAQGITDVNEDKRATPSAGTESQDRRTVRPGVGLGAVLEVVSKPP